MVGFPIEQPDFFRRFPQIQHVFLRGKQGTESIFLHQILLKIPFAKNNLFDLTFYTDGLTKTVFGISENCFGYKLIFF